MKDDGGGRARSIRHRLRNRLRERGEDVQFGLPRYAIERLLYRVGISRHKERFVLKGAVLFELWGSEVYRPTRDLDLAAFGSSDVAQVLAALREVCDLQPEAHPLVFETDDLEATPIRHDSEYLGLRVQFCARLGKSRIPMQVDIGFGNAIEPPAREVEFPTLLDDPPPRIQAYPKEAVVAEKFHAMALLGEANSRLKDFYDLYVLARHFQFDGELVSHAVQSTFLRRSTEIASTKLPVALTPRFYDAEMRAGQWRGYCTSNSLSGAPADFTAVGELIQSFLGPIWQALASIGRFPARWPPGGPWRTASAGDEGNYV